MEEIKFDLKSFIAKTEEMLREENSIYYDLRKHKQKTVDYRVSQFDLYFKDIQVNNSYDMTYPDGKTKPVFIKSKSSGSMYLVLQNGVYSPINSYFDFWKFSFKKRNENYKIDIGNLVRIDLEKYFSESRAKSVVPFNLYYGKVKAINKKTYRIELKYDKDKKYLSNEFAGYELLVPIEYCELEKGE